MWHCSGRTGSRTFPSSNEKKNVYKYVVAECDVHLCFPATLPDEIASSFNPVKVDFWAPTVETEDAGLGI